MKVLVGLSGGVDSAVAAYLLKEQGHEVIGVMMSIWDGSIPAPKNKNINACLGPEDDDIETVHKIASFLMIPVHILDCTRYYKKIVIENFKNEYREGRTPNPCIWCNVCVKFGILPRMAKESGIIYDKFATGHYANVAFNNTLNMYQLHKADDNNKDQTYFLYRLSQKTLAGTVFPVGRITKGEVRNIAKKIGLPVAEKSDSQDFYCGDYNDILQFPESAGYIVDKNGNILGRHKGIWNYTIGKRRGLGLQGGVKDRLYVINILAEQNLVVVGNKEDLYSRSFAVKKVVWGSIPVPDGPIETNVKIRRQHIPARAVVIPNGIDEVMVEFKEPQEAVTAGQSAVFYQGDIVLGGGIIT
ncbi:MAG: tRNA 2-thiouridine(34) synthase MnmA [Endomicrobium sp.]|jgi:tRNA-specific 2-thiouridylase|nr:tRNA 2-thiouridine(34) synthase MnmA [Endomicrobium sp.]